MKRNNFLPNWYTIKNKKRETRLFTLLVIIMTLGNFLLYCEHNKNENTSRSVSCEVSVSSKDNNKDLRTLEAYVRFCNLIDSNMKISNLKCTKDTISSDINIIDKKIYISFLKKLESNDSFEIVNISPINTEENKFKFTIELKYI